MADTVYTADQLRAAAAKAAAAGDKVAEQELLAAADALEPPTQRLRAAAQGATLGFADEALAALQHPLSAIGSALGTGDAGKAYEEALQSERDALKKYRQAYPYSSLAWELGGAAIPALATGGGSAPASGAGLLGTIGRAALTGATTGAAYGFGSGEGGLANRLTGGAAGALGGGVAGGAIGAAGGALKTIGAGRLVDWVRNKFGDRIAGPVEFEIRRMAEQTGMSPEAIVAEIAAGRIMAENKTLADMVRRFTAEGGPASAEIKGALSERPTRTQSEAIGAVQSALSRPGNPLMQRAADEAATRAAERAAYGGAFQATPAVPQNVVDLLARVAEIAPEALKDAAKAARLNTGTRPFFRETESGGVEFTRVPSLEEAESVYRALRDLAGSAYSEGKGAIGEGYKTLRDTVKGELDVASPALQTARSEAQKVRDARDAFVAGQKAITMSPDALALEVQRMEAMDPSALAAFREGFVTAVRAQAAKPSAAPALLRNLTSEATGPGTALRTLLPPGQTADQVLSKLQTAEGARAASQYILGGSATAKTMMAPGVGEMSNVAQDAVQALGLDPMAAFRLIGSVAKMMQPRLTDAQRLEVAKILVSEDPALVQRALTDNTMVGRLQEATQRAIARVTAGAARAAGPATAPITNPNARR